MGQHLYTYNDPPNEKHLAQAVHVLENDGVIAYPTEGLWAFGCDPRSRKAMEKIRLLKPYHPKEQPFSMLCSSISMASHIGAVRPSLYRLLKKAWPGPYTVLLSATRELPKQLREKRKVVGIRIPQLDMLRALVEKFGRPIATTSVPAHDEQEIRFGYQVYESYGHGVDLLLDLGEEGPGIPSTVIDMSTDEISIVREGLGDTSMFGLS